MQDRQPGSEARSGKTFQDGINPLTRAGRGDESMQEVLIRAIKAAQADFGTVQRYDSAEDCLRIVANCGFPDEALNLFRIVRRDTNSTCAATLKKRMRTVVGNIAASYLFVGTSELEALQEVGVAAAHSAPIIVDKGRLWGVLTVHFRQPWEDAEYDPTPMERVAVRFAKRLKDRTSEQTFSDRDALTIAHSPVSTKTGSIMRSSAAPIPLAGSMLREHRHVCAFFCSADDEYNALLPFICDGLDCGQRGFHVLPERHVDDHVTRLRSGGIDVEAAQRSGQLEIALPQDTYLRTGRFNKEDMLNLIQHVLQNGAALGFPLTRMIAHPETALDNWKSRNDWAEYEMRLNSVLSNFDDAVICTFDVNLLTTALAIDILRTHPVVVIGGVLVENTFFSKPEDFLREVTERTSASQPYRG
ncbi:MEDS domain-containing protein [Bradyrhizobium liaoningense]|uniref:MEDS domain-containing protein n=1 Tax=Bradyrhizobium TaxID=374 RepID=UPI001BAA450D|nr:MEDS domain-containing protein [Bradyrhizobium liaoningense]MBR1168983.1 MEDS domain-containing protein [Bradyrhizobium liaoningense]